MKERTIKYYPDALISCSIALLLNSKLVTPFLRILLNKTNVYDYEIVEESI